MLTDVKHGSIAVDPVPIRAGRVKNVQERDRVQNVHPIANAVDTPKAVMAQVGNLHMFNVYIVTKRYGFIRAAHMNANTAIKNVESRPIELNERPRVESIVQTCLTKNLRID